MSGLNNIPKVFASEDTVFHYTTTMTAIEHILYTKSLMLTPRKKSNDPIENLENLMSFSSYSGTDEVEFDKKAKEFHRALKEKIKSAKQICFCMNPSEGIHMVPPAEKYGFLKPRMWDQYGDKYKGVCLAFSKIKLIEKHNELAGAIDYIKYSDLNANHISIDSSMFSALGEQKHLEKLMEKLNSSFLRKHIDYAGESEYRMLSFNEFDRAFINITESLNGIIASDAGLSPFTLETLRKYSSELGVPLIFVKFTNSGIHIITNEEKLRTEALVKQILKKD